MIPEGWTPATFGDVLKESDERVNQRLDLPVLSVTKTRGPMLASERFGKVLHSRDLSHYRVARGGDIVADPMLLWDGSIGIQDIVPAGIVSPDYRVYRTEPTAVSEFMRYVVRNPAMLPAYRGNARGTNVRRNRIARGDFLRIPLPLPPLPEQKKIAAILSSVDAAIESTEAVIEQLRAVKKAMMAELLTRGIPGRHTKFKMTEIGEVPEGWRVVPAESVFADGPSNGRSPPSKTFPPGVPTFSISAVRSGHVNIAANLKYAEGDPETLRTSLVRRGDILIVRGNGNPELVGCCGMVVEEPPQGCIYPDILIRVRPSEDLLPNFFVTLWNCQVVHDQVLDKAKTTNGTYKINGQDVRDILVPVPSKSEQQLIGDAVRSVETSGRAYSVKLAGLQDFRTALMSALLTGEVRVKPDEAAA